MHMNPNINHAYKLYDAFTYAYHVYTHRKLRFGGFQEDVFCRIMS